MKTKTHGWVVQDKSGTFADKSGTFVDKYGLNVDINEAFVFKTRKAARTANDGWNKLSTDVIRKVKINKNNEAVRIIPGK